MKEILEQYTRYNHWANARIIQMAEEMSTSKLDQDVYSSFPTLRKTLYHIWDAETVWHRRLFGHSHVGPLAFSAEFAGTHQEAFEKWLEVSAAFISYVDDHNDADLKEILHYKNTKGDAFAESIYLILMHVMNHSTYHRGQAVTILRELGATKIQNMDFIGFLRNQTK